MIEQRILSSGTIEIYVNGGGYITQRQPTQCRRFRKCIMLSADDSVENYREATAAERQQWLAAHGGYEDVPLPGRTVMTPIYEAAGVVFNDATGFYELNGLTDIDEEEMLYIWTHGRQEPPYLSPIDDPRLRTNLWIGGTLREYDQSPKMYGMYRVPNMEVLRLATHDDPTTAGFGVRPSELRLLLNMSNKGIMLRRIIGIIDCQLLTNIDMPFHPSATFEYLEELWLYKVKCNLNIAQCPALRLDCLRYIVETSINTARITIKVHSRIMEKILNGEEGWAELAADADKKLITITS